MKKMLCLAFLALVFYSANAQEAARPHRINVPNPGDYFIGGTPVDEKDIDLHLEKTGPESASKLWQRHKSLRRSSTYGLLSAGGGLALILLANKNDIATKAGIGIAAVGFSASIVCTIGSYQNSKKAISDYNKHWGYKP